jgi:hypothetical protein
MRRFSIRIACTVALLLACASVSSAQDTTLVSQGARVKVFPAMAGAEPVIGEVVKLAYDTLVIMPEGNGSALTIYRDDYRKIEVSQGKGKTYTVIGLLGGMAVGAGVGIATAPCLGAEDNCDSDLIGDFSVVAPAMKILAYAAIGGLVGVGVGALIDLVIIGERWKEADMPPPPPVALNVGKDGSVRLAFSLRL